MRILGEWSLKLLILAFLMMGGFTAGFAANAPARNPSKADAAARRPGERDWWGHGGKFMATEKPSGQEPDNAFGLPLLKNIARDQKTIWTSPFHLRLRDANWLLPLAGLGAALLATDSATSRHLAISRAGINQSRSFSNFGAASLIGVAGSLYLWGRARHNEHMRETGLLSGEAVIDSYLAATAVKTAAGRERPYVDNAQGRFLRGGSSFPSEHAAAVWSTAGIIAHEYPGPLTKLFAYGLAAAVSGSRVTGEEHFPSDVLVGGVLGLLISREVYQKSHNPELWGSAWRVPGHDRSRERERNPENMGSPYVPLDSWVYPAFERLAALGYVRSEMLGMRPWTRLECARLVEEATDRLSARETDAPLASRLVGSLQKEFAGALALLGGGRNRAVDLDSVYTRFTGIAGTPLTDGYHFGQTLENDYGRPYGEGLNTVAGFSGWAASGPFAAYFQGEYQHAPSGLGLPPGARQFISQVDYGLPLPPAGLYPAVDRFDALNAYVAMNLENWQVSAGKQSLWWGPGEGGAMMYSDNAEPVDMIRISRVSPFKLPGPFALMGPVRTEFFIGKQSGANFLYSPMGLVGQWGAALNPQPIMIGQKLSFKPTPNLEFGFDRTTIYGGPGYPLTPHTFLRSLFSTTNDKAGSPNKPGDRRSGFDMTYRLPFVRNWATFYVDSFVDDQFSPVAYFDRACNSAGLYFARLPRLQKFDLRLEGVYSDSPLGGLYDHGYFYANYTWRYGYRNAGNLLGSWIGRQGQGEQAWLTYWPTPRSDLQFQFRHETVGQGFIPGGGTINDGGVKANFWLRPDLSVTAFLQDEKWSFPVLRPGPQSNVTASVQLTFWPRWSFH